MLYLMLVLFLSAALYAQTPPPLASDQQADKPPVAAEPGKPDAFQPSQSGQGKPYLPAVPEEPGKSLDAPVPTWRLLPLDPAAKPPSAKWKLLPSGKSPAPPAPMWGLFSFGKNGQPAFVKRDLLPKNFVATPPLRPCAVPLTNVLRSPRKPLQVRRIAIPDAQYPMTEVPLPAPSCDDRK
jgi:hypothetical protein